MAERAITVHLFAYQCLEPTVNNLHLGHATVEAAAACCAINLDVL